MMISFFHLFFYLLCFIVCTAHGWWPFDEIHQSDSPSSENSESKSDRMVPFEVATAEQKFLQEAKQLLNLSPLDTCQHQVVESLRHSCGKLSEEDIAKLSVQLLNCQSEAEGRETYKCSSDMSIADCTGPMDAHTWNAYHIISNRARSVCYSIRQTQFRIQAETAVNRLSQTTVYQLRAMEQLSNSQDEIRQSTLASLDALKKEKEELAEQQSAMNAYHEKLKVSMEENVQQLNEERTLITSGQSLIHNMTGTIQKQLGVAQDLLQDQEVSRIKHHKNMSDELRNMRENIKEVWSNIDDSTDRLLKVVHRLNVQYEDMQIRLNTINNTLSHVLSLLDTMNEAINVQLGWLMDRFGGAQDGLHLLTAIACHGVFLLVNCLVLLFLKAPWLSRLMLLVVVVVNMIIEVNSPSTGLPLTQLEAIIVTILIGDFIFLSVTYHQMQYGSKYMTVKPIAPPSESTESSRHTIDISDDEVNDLVADINQNGGYLPNTNVAPTDITPNKSRYTPPLHSSSTPGIEEFSKCMGITRNGLPCRLGVSPGSPYCFRHR